MKSLTKAAIRLPWALSVFGAQEFIGGVLKAKPSPKKKTLADLYAVTEASQAQFEGEPYIYAAYQIGDRVQRAVAGAVHDAVALKVLDPGYLGSVGAGILDRSLGAIGALATSSARRVTVQVAKNKVEVVRLVTQVQEKLNLPEYGDIYLPDMIEEAWGLGEYPAMWAIEGLGERYTRNAFRTCENPAGLLTEGQGAGLADRTLPMMHAGLGIALAKNLLARVSPWIEAGKMDREVTRFLSLVAANSRPGYSGPAIGSLGLVAGSWHRQMLKPLSESLARVDMDAREFYWHGVGRGSYFDPMSMVPGYPEWKQSETQPSDNSARLNARAGLAWAFAAVNVRHPDIVADVLRCNIRDIGKTDGFSNGVASVMILARETVPQDKYISAFCAYRPTQSDSKTANAWKEQLGNNFRDRVETYRQNLRDTGKLGELFRYHKLSEFAVALPVESQPVIVTSQPVPEASEPAPVVIEFVAEAEIHTDPPATEPAPAVTKSAPAKAAPHRPRKSAAAKPAPSKRGRSHS